MQDRNFDDLAEKFASHIYGTLKGEIRQLILWQELNNILASLPAAPLRVLDAGGGIGQIATGLAQQGHNVTVCDLSGKMLARAQEYAEQHQVSQQMNFLQMNIREMPEAWDDQYDLVLFHAVLEWVSEPQQILAKLYRILRPGGILSIMFYNLHGLTLRNLTLGNFGYLQAEMKKRKKQTLSPDYPRDPAEVYDWLQQAGFRLERKAGIRVFSDMLRTSVNRAEKAAEIVAMEQRYCRQEPFLSLGRYIHVTASKLIQKDE
jgi:S-adenosylmethionine-dependent methyltransferase